MKLSINSGSFDFGELDFFKTIKEAGFDACDFALAKAEDMTDAELERYCAEVKRDADNAGVEIGQTHSGFSGHPEKYNFDYELIYEKTVKSIKATRLLGAKYVVIHPIILPGRYNDKLVDENYKLALDFYKRFIPVLEENDVYGCIENMWVRDPIFHRCCATILSRATELVKMCDELGDRYRICVDNGHGELTQDKPEEMLAYCGDRVAVLHCHGTDGISDLHSIPYGVYRTPPAANPIHTDWEKFMQTLDEIGYKGNLNFEINLAKTIPQELSVPALKYLGGIAKYFLTLRKEG